MVWASPRIDLKKRPARDASGSRNRLWAGWLRWAAARSCTLALGKAPSGSCACPGGAGAMNEEEAPTVMVVDDHPIWREAVARDLAEDGFNVVATADGVGA